MISTSQASKATGKTYYGQFWRKMMASVKLFSPQLPGTPLVDYFLIDVDRPNSWDEGTDERAFCEQQKALGKTGVQKFYDKKPRVKQMDFKESQSIEKHNTLIREVKEQVERRHAVANIRPCIKWEKSGERAWRGLGAARVDRGVKIWDETYYIGWPPVFIANDPPFTATFEPSGGPVFELGTFPSLGAAMRACNRRNVLVHQERKAGFK